jgi:hypothetical protein
MTGDPGARVSTNSAMRETPSDERVEPVRIDNRGELARHFSPGGRMRAEQTTVRCSCVVPETRSDAAGASAATGYELALDR